MYREHADVGEVGQCVYIGAKQNHGRDDTSVGRVVTTSSYREYQWGASGFGPAYTKDCYNSWALPPNHIREIGAHFRNGGLCAVGGWVTNSQQSSMAHWWTDRPLTDLCGAGGWQTSDYWGQVRAMFGQPAVYNVEPGWLGGEIRPASGHGY